MKYNYHTHTSRCGHAKGSDGEYILAAIQAKLEVLGISDHIPYPSVSIKTDRMDESEWDEYLSTFQALKEKYKNEIEIRIGVEFEYHDSYSDFLTEIKEQCDYMICGQHDKDIGFYDYGIKCTDEDLIQYTKDLVAGIEKGFTDLVAHPDYFMLGRTDWSK